MSKAFSCPNSLFPIIFKITMITTKNNKVLPKEITASLNELKKEAIKEKTLIESDDFDIFGGAAQDLSKISKINNKKHREISKDKFSILDINKNTKQIGYKLSLQDIIENVKTAIEKVNVCEDLPIYKAIDDKLINEKDINIFNINPEAEIKEAIERQEAEEINFYKINLKQGANGISFTNCIFYDNQNKTLPIGQDLSTKILIDISKLKMELKNKTTFKILDYKTKNNDFSDIEIKKVNVFEYDV